MIEQERFNEAEEILIESTEKIPESFVLWSELGHLRHNNLNKHNEALEAFEVAKKISPTNPEVYLWIGSCFERKGYFKSAESNYQKSITLSPKNEKNIIRYLTFLNERKRYNDALLHINNFLKNNKSSLNISAINAYTLKKLGRYLEGAKILADLSKENKNHHFEAGSCYFKAKHYQEALFHLNQIYNIPQYSIKSLEMIIPSQFYLKFYDNSCNAADVLLKLDNNNICSIDYKSKSLLLQGFNNKCLEFLLKYQEIVNTNYNILITYISALISDNNFNEVEIKINYLLKNHLNSDVLLFVHNYYSKKLKDETLAEKIINNYTINNSKLKSTYLFKIAINYYKKGELNKALKYAKNSINEMPIYWKSYELILKCYHDLNQPIKVVQTLDEMKQKGEIPENFLMKVHIILSNFLKDAINSKDDNKIILYNISSVLILGDSLVNNIKKLKDNSTSEDIKLLFEHIEIISECEILLLQADENFDKTEFQNKINKSIEIAEKLNDVITKKLLKFNSCFYELILCLNNPVDLELSLNNLSKYIINKEEIDKFVIEVPAQLIEMLMLNYKQKVRIIFQLLIDSLDEIKENIDVLNILKLFSQLNIELNGITEESITFDAIVTYYQGDYKVAAELAEIALGNNPRNKVMLLLKCDSEYNQEEYEKALETSNLYIEINGRDIQCDNRQINIYKKLNRFEKSKEIEQSVENLLINFEMKNSENQNE
ncbi:MAG: hypothetical protein K8R58_07265 [Bacteroidales bacterium]|nr:hypothetical protein [Bacteroidales bacterium]